ncbi:MAG: DUF72 domain-containing protein [Acidobacteriia bacterium]|nr:DUF72 domain-containing protein [Terriglobia bacterium]
MDPIPNLRLGTSSWSSEDWLGVFYPPNTLPANFLAEYAKHFDTVEVDATFYRPPSMAMVKNWRERTPPGFLFAAKFPQVITHEKVMQDCRDDMRTFLSAMELLGDKLGPLLLQFPYFNKQAFASWEGFASLLDPFLDQLPRDYRYALEIRNKYWINRPFLDLLRKKNVALALIAHPWMTPVTELMSKQDVVTADFTYLRWLGDRKGIEEKTKHWDRVIIDREEEMEIWIPVVRQLLRRGIRLFGYFNNHYAGYAPGSVDLFRKVWDRTKS